MNTLTASPLFDLIAPNNLGHGDAHPDQVDALENYVKHPHTVSYMLDTSSHITELEAIRRRAYEIFEARCGYSDDEVEDWLRAQQEIKHHLRSQGPRGTV